MPARQLTRILFAILLLCNLYSHQKRFASPTAASRLDLLHGVIEQGTLEIDAYHENTPDKAVFNEHYYSDKAPGTVALAFPAFAVTATVLRLSGVSLGSDKGWLVSSWVSCAASDGILAALGGLTLFAWLAKRVPPRCALITVLALFLGAAPLPYATMMFSHSMVVGLLAVAIWAIQNQTECGVRSAECGIRERGIRGSFRVNRWSLLAGHACGWALASEYTAGLVVLGLFLWLVWGRWRFTLPFCLAAMPPLLLILAYNWMCFGNPFVLPYSLQASFPAMKEGLYAIKWPNAVTAYNLLFSPTRGVFFWTPFLGLAVFGYWKMIKTNAPLFWLLYTIPVLQVIVISGRVWDWQAGPTIGPRYLAPILPLMALPCALGLQRFPKLGMCLAFYSILITSLATLTDACAEENIYNPLLELDLPLLEKGELSHNLGMALGLPPYASIALYYIILIAGIAWLWRGLSPGENQTSLTEKKSSDAAKINS